MYWRGALQLKFQVRSCNDGSCLGETFVGPDNTAATYFGEGANLNKPNFPINFLPSNRYFQYRAYFETINSALTPQLRSVNYNGHW